MKSFLKKTILYCLSNGEHNHTGESESINSINFGMVFLFHIPNMKTKGNSMKS